MNNALDNVNTNEMSKQVADMRAQLNDKMQAMEAESASAVILGKLGEGEFALEIQMNGKHHAKKTNLPATLLGSLFPSITIPVDTLKQASMLLSNMITMTFNDGVSKVEAHSRASSEAFMKEMSSNPEDMKSQLDEKIKAVHSGLESAVILGKLGEGDFALEIQMNGKHHVKKTNLPSTLLGSLFPGISIPEDNLQQSTVLLSNMITMAINDGVSKVDEYSKESYKKFMEIFNKEASTE